MTCQYPFGKYKLGTKYGKKGKMWACGWHSGQDFFCRAIGGDGKIHPIAPGKVTVSADTNRAYGNHVIVQHEDGYLSLYAHMSKRLVNVGDVVSYDSILGIEGTTGNSTGVHLHLEIHKGRYIYPSSYDPIAYIEARLPYEDVAIAPTKYTVTAKTSLLVRVAPHSVADVVGAYIHGAEITATAISKDGKWAKTSEGWCSTKYLKEVKTTPVKRHRSFWEIHTKN